MDRVEPVPVEEPSQSERIEGRRLGDPRKVVAAALAHRVRNQVEATYRRTDLFERRRRLMVDWADYLAGGTSRS